MGLRPSPNPQPWASVASLVSLEQKPKKADVVASRGVGNSGLPLSASAHVEWLVAGATERGSALSPFFVPSHWACPVGYREAVGNLLRHSCFKTTSVGIWEIYFYISLSTKRKLRKLFAAFLALPFQDPADILSQFHVIFPHECYLDPCNSLEVL